LHAMTDHHQCFRPIPQLIEELNRHLGDWKNCFDFGYPRVAFGEINTYVRAVSHSICYGAANGPSLPPEEVSYYEQIQRFGLVRL
jgi:RNA-directed DNA polymerase